jgi:hypothetical protein
MPALFAVDKTYLNVPAFSAASAGSGGFTGGLGSIDVLVASCRFRSIRWLPFTQQLQSPTFSSLQRAISHNV